MLDREIYLGSNFAVRPCPICGGMFSKCGLPNHIRRHKKTEAAKSSKDPMINRRSPAWWDGWKEGYRVGMRDGSNERRKMAGKRAEKSYNS